MTKTRKILEQQKEQAAEQAKPRCSICGKYTDKKTSPQCYGHAGGVTGGGSSDGAGAGAASQNKADQAMTASGKTASGEVPVRANISAPYSTVAAPGMAMKFTTAAIADLLAKKILIIDNDCEGTLKIKLLPGFALSTEQKTELQKFFNTMINEIDNFKKDQGITTECKTIDYDKDGNISFLRISLPTAALYDAFIKRLADKNLLPKQILEQHAKNKFSHQEGVNDSKQTPLATAPTPKNKKSVDEETQTVCYNPTKIPSPHDGLKRK